MALGQLRSATGQTEGLPLRCFTCPFAPKFLEGGDSVGQGFNAVERGNTISWTERENGSTANCYSFVQHDCTLNDNGLSALVLRSVACDSGKPDTACTYEGSYALSDNAGLSLGTSHYLGNATYERGVRVR